MQPADDFDAFVARRHRALVRSAFLLTGDTQLAEDLVQTALYRTFRRWPHLRAAGAAETYARTAMVRLALRWRSRRWSGEIPSDHLPEPPAELTQEQVATGLDVWRALSTLPIAQRAVLVLRYLEDLSEAETATVLQCSVGTVKSRASRALGALRSSELLMIDDVTGGSG